MVKYGLAAKTICNKDVLRRWALDRLTLRSAERPPHGKPPVNNRPTAQTHFARSALPKLCIGQPGAPTSPCEAEHQCVCVCVCMRRVFREEGRLGWGRRSPQPTGGDRSPKGQGTHGGATTHGAAATHGSSGTYGPSGPMVLSGRLLKAERGLRRRGGSSCGGASGGGRSARRSRSNFCVSARCK